MATSYWPILADESKVEAAMAGTAAFQSVRGSYRPPEDLANEAWSGEWI